MNIKDYFMKMKSQKGMCEVCGCTDNNPCYTHEHGACWWIDDRHTLCSHCYYGYYEQPLETIFNDLNDKDEQIEIGIMGRASHCRQYDIGEFDITQMGDGVYILKKENGVIKYCYGGTISELEKQFF